MRKFLWLILIAAAALLSFPDRAPAYYGGGFVGARVYNDADLIIPNITSTKLTFNSERYDTSNFHEGVTNPSRLTAPVSGYYRIHGNTAFAGNATGTRSLDILLNNADDIAAANSVPNGSGTSVQVIDCEYYLSVGDYVEFRVYQSSGGNLNISTIGNYSPEFSISLIK